MPTARIIEICDAIVSTITAAWMPTAPDGVSREYGKEISLTKDHPGDLLIGRQVYVFPVSGPAGAMIDREAGVDDYEFAVLICERYTNSDGSVAPAGLPTRAWMDERVLFVEEKIFRVLSDPFLELLGGAVIPLPPDAGDIDSVYDRDLFMQRRTFWSTCSFTFREVT